METTRSNRGGESQGDSGKLRRIEALFITLIAIFLTLSIITNIVHEYDLSSSSSIVVPPQFSGTTAFDPAVKSAVVAKDETAPDKSSSALSKDNTANDEQREKSNNSNLNEAAIRGKHEVKMTKEVKDDDEKDQGDGHKLGGLSCAKFGGPPDEIALEMVYWSDIPSDSDFESPFKRKKKDGPVQYMTFEPDGGGWNNIR